MTKSTAADPADQILVERVRKLLDKAARTDNPHEADAFAAKAAELVAQHRIDPARLASSAADPAELAVREAAVAAGTTEFTVEVEWTEKVIDVGGRPMFVEGRAIASASGRPHLH